MANHKSDPLFLHPILHARLAGILAEAKKNLPAGWKTLALQTVLGTTERTADAWEQLYKLYIKYGPLESRTTFQQFGWIPQVA